MGLWLCRLQRVTGAKADLAYEFVNWFLDGWAGAYLNRQGYYSAVLETAEANMESYEWAYWMQGKPAEKDIKAPDGTLLEKAGSTRDGGSYNDRMGAVACWNAVMDETIIWFASGTSLSRREHNTLPMELQGLTTTVTTPEIYALGTATTGLSFIVIAMGLMMIMVLRSRQARFGSDAGKGMV
jgi:hypothetical protein